MKIKEAWDIVKTDFTFWFMGWLITSLALILVLAIFLYALNFR